MVREALTRCALARTGDWLASQSWLSAQNRSFLVIGLIVEERGWWVADAA